MTTLKLYWSEPFAVEFEAPEARLSSFGGRASVVLGRTLFYPEAGGQLPDTGSLTVGDQTLTIVDVQIDEAGTIHHVASELGAGADVAIAPAGRAAVEALPVRGRIDGDRRRDHMSQHTAQHMLSRALVDVAKAETVSSRLGASACTIDVDVAELSDADLLRAEDLVNAV